MRKAPGSNALLSSTGPPCPRPWRAAAERTRWRRRNVGFIFQQFNLIPTLTLIENVSVPLLINGAGRRVVASLLPRFLIPKAPSTGAAAT